MHSNVRLHVLAMIASFIMAGCATVDSPGNKNALSGTSWVLSSLHGQPVPPQDPITMHFEQDRIQGSDGCNRYGTSYTATGSQFKAGENIVSTRMACPEPVMLHAEAFLSALTMASVYKQEPQRLTLLDANGNALATFATQGSSLGGTSWHVTGYNNGKQAVVSVIVGSELTADFKADGSLGGSAGCNVYAATYTTSGKSIKIDQAATTRKMCAQPEGLMKQEAQYLKALSTAATYRLDGNRLELRTTAGALAVTLSSADNP
jgi:heat shock protein HslJ